MDIFVMIMFFVFLIIGVATDKQPRVQNVCIVGMIGSVLLLLLLCGIL